MARGFTIWLALLVGRAFSACNSSIEFDCKMGGECIPLEWRCDNMNDCSNGADENNCAYLHECAIGMMICRDGECVSSTFKCDGQNDCADGTDELGCPPVKGTFSLSAARDCSVNDFHCHKSSFCIPGSAKCDGSWDCAMGEDEDDCPKPRSQDVTPTRAGAAPPEKMPFAEISDLKCKEDEMRCADGASCIPTTWVCDGQSDCGDKSDEADCESDEATHEGDSVALMDLMGTFSHILCPASTYRCEGDGVCVDYAKTCDGRRDCSRGDDEGGQCGECKHAGCHDRCIDTPHGPRCACSTGYVLGHDGVSCEKVDMCKEEGHKCSHFCEPQHNGFVCSCATGYTLSVDKRTCHLHANLEGVLFLSLGTEIREMPLFSPQMSSLGYTTLQSMSSFGTTQLMDFDVSTETLYVTMPGVHTTGALGVWSNGTMRVVRTDVAGINDIAVDWLGGNIFFTAKYPSKNPGIYVCTRNAVFCKQIVRGQDKDEDNKRKRQSYRGLAVHPQRGLMAWLESYDGHHRIMMANMDGSNVKVILHSKLELPSGLSFDPIKNDLYFTDGERSLIEKVNIDTLDRMVVLSAGVQTPFDIKFFNGFIFFTDWGTHTLKMATLGMTHTAPHLIHIFQDMPHGIAINHTMYQPPMPSHPCPSTHCAWICVGVWNGDEMEAKCICPEGYEKSTEEGGALCRLKKAEDKKEHEYETPSSGVLAMKTLCDRGEACLNGGYCVEEEDGGTTTLMCKCPSGFSGLACEWDTELGELKGEEENEEHEGDSEGFKLGTVLFFILLIIGVALGFYWSYKNNTMISTMTKSAVNRVAEVNIPSPMVAASSIRNRLALHRPSTAPSPSSAGYSCARSTSPSPLSTRRQNNPEHSNYENPLFEGSAAPYDHIPRNGQNDSCRLVIEPNTTGRASF